MPTENVVQDQIQKFASNIASARKDYDALALKLAENPGDLTISQELDGIEKEVAEYKKSIARLEAAAAEAVRRNSKTARRTRLELLKAQRARLAKVNTDTEEIAAKLNESLVAIGVLLAQLQRAIEDRSADARAIIAGTRGDNSLARSAQDTASGLVNFSTGEVVEALARVIADTGLGRTGVALDPYVVVTAPSRLFAQHTLGAAVAKANFRLLAAIDDRLAKHKKLLRRDDND